MCNIIMHMQYFEKLPFFDVSVLVTVDPVQCFSMQVVMNKCFFLNS